MKILHIICTALLVVNFVSCKKSSPSSNTSSSSSTDQTTLKKNIINDIAHNVIYATYVDLSNKADALNADVTNLNSVTSAENLLACQNSWKALRQAWEQGEGFLFGPVSTENIDPRVDTWPVDFARLDSVLASSATFDADYINGLEESLKGFHPIEYLLFGKDGNKTETEFTAREKEYLMALTANLQSLCNTVKDAWTNGYTNTFTNPGSNNAIYGSQRAVYEEIIDAMSGICEEVAGGKLKEPFEAVDPMLEESPFAKNSINDFTNNIKSVQNMYLGKYTTDGKGLEDLIKANNLSMDGEIKSKINAAITALSNITLPFGQAILTTNGQRQQVQAAMEAIGKLQQYLDATVKPYIQTLVN